MRSLRYLLIPVLGAIVCAGWCEVARAQVPAGLLPASPSAKASLYDTAPIVIDGATVIRIAGLANTPPGGMPLETRVFLINGAIAQVLTIEPDSEATVYDPKSLVIKTVQSNGQYVLEVTDDRHHSAFPLLTVTSDDVLQSNLPARELAARWQTALQQALVLALERRQPEQIHRNTTLLAYIATVLVVLTIAGIIVVRLQPASLLAASTPWIVALLWIAGIAFGLTLFPQTVSTGHLMLSIGGRIVIIWMSAFLLERFLALTIRQTVVGWASFGIDPDKRGRSLLRVPTITKSLIGSERIFVFFLAVLLSLSALNVPIASVITIGGIAAVALGFAAQSLVRDCLNGLLVLFEDQYVEGDFIMIGEFNGIVEHLTLRVVQLRDGNGNLITIPHSAVNQVVNASRNWSRIDYRVTVAATADLQKAMTVLRDTIEELKTDVHWRDAIINPMEWMGVETMTVGGTTLRASIRTEPLRQYELRREINLRMADALKRAGIALGSETLPPVIIPAASPDPK